MDGEEFVVNLVEVADPSAIGGYRNRGDGGAVLPQTLLNVRSDTQVKGTLVNAIHGTLIPKGRPASLLIFEFDLTAPIGTRFTEAIVRLVFEDNEGQSTNDPEIHKFSPKGVFALNKEIDTRDVTHGVDAALNANPFPAAGLNLGYHWMMSRTKKKPHFARLNGTTDSTQRDREATIAIWTINEDPKTKEIPTFLKTAVVLRHNPYGADETSRKFNVMLEIVTREKSGIWRAGVTKLEKMHKPMMLNPDVWEDTTVKELGLEKLKAKEAAPEELGPEKPKVEEADDLVLEKLKANLGGMDLDSQFLVRIAQVLNA